MCVVVEREAVLEFMAKSLQSLRLCGRTAWNCPRTRGKIVAEPETVAAEFGIHGMVVDKRDAVLEFMV